MEAVEALERFFVVHRQLRRAFSGWMELQWRPYVLGGCSHWCGTTTGHESLGGCLTNLCGSGKPAPKPFLHRLVQPQGLAPVLQGRVCPNVLRAVW